MFKDREQGAGGGETEREKAKVCVKGESSWLLPRPLRVPGPPCWQTAHNICLQSPLWPRRKGLHTARSRKGDWSGGGEGAGWARRRLEDAWPSGGTRAERGLREPGCPTTSASSFWVRKMRGNGCPIGLCADALSSLESTSIAPKAAERAQKEGGLLLGLGL